MPWSPLPAPMRPYSFADELPVIRTPFESGPPRVKRFSSDYTTTFSVQVYLTDAQLDAFRTFFDDPAEADRGANYFEMPLITRGNLVDHLVRILSVNGERVGAGWRLSMQLESRERNN